MDPIITSALTSFVTTVATNSSQVPMKTLDDLWYLAFGKINHLVDKKKAEREIALAEYKNSIAEKVLSIADDNLQEPPLSVVGPALEASKYYIEEEILREMFAKVISSSMDKTKSPTVHHSFVEIIKQLSPEDAKNIELFKSKQDYPVIQFRLSKLNETSYKVLNTNVFHGRFSDIVSGNENAASVTNLQRLGLVNITYQESYTSKEQYKVYKNSSYLQSIESLYNPNQRKIELGEGVMRLTPFGQAFIDICL